jgi:hypothetical protein
MGHNTANSLRHFFFLGGVLVTHFVARASSPLCSRKSGREARATKVPVQGTLR